MFEFDSYIGQIQGCLLSRASSSQSNPDLEQLEKLCERVGNVFKKCPPSYETRNILLYILLNCDLDVLEDISEDVNFSHLIKTVPCLSVSDALSLILNLNGVKFLGEVLKFAPPALSIPVMDKILEMVHENLRCITDRHTIAMELANASLHKIVHGESESIGVLNIFLCFLKSLLDVELQESVESNVYKENTNSTSILGEALLKNLELCLCCFEDSSENHGSCWDGYLMQCLPYDATNRLGPANYSLTSHTEVMFECKKVVLASSVKLVQIVSLSDWLDWAEISTDQSRTMQQCIGEMAHMLLSSLKKQEQKFSDIPLMLEILSHFAVEPERDEERIANASLEDFIARFADRKSNGKMWMKGLVLREDLLENEDCLQLIQSNYSMLDSEDVSCLLNHLVSKMKTDNFNLEKKELLRIFCYKIMKELPFASIKRIHEDYFDKHGMNQDLCTQDFPSLLLEAFNKTSFGSEEYSEEWCSELVRLSLQNPSAVGRKIIEVGLEDTSLAKIMSSTLALMRPISEEILLSWLFEISVRWPFNESQMDAFPIFVKELLKQGLLPRATFFRSHVVPALHLAVDFQNWDVALVWLSVLKLVLTDVEVDPHKVCRVAVLLGYMGQVMDKCEQSINHFTLSCVQVRQKVIEVIQSLRTHHLNALDKNWLKHLIKKHSLLTQSQLASFVCDNSSISSTRDPALRLYALNNFFQEKVISPQVAACILVEVLPSLTSFEWRSLADALKKRFDNYDDSSLLVFQAFQKAMFLLASAMSEENFSSNSISCLNHCICCLGTVIKMDLFPALKPSNFRIILEETLQLLNKLPSEVWDRGGMSILPLLVNLSEEITPDSNAHNSLSSLVGACPSNQAQALLVNKIVKLHQDVPVN